MYSTCTQCPFWEMKSLFSTKNSKNTCHSCHWGGSSRKTDIEGGLPKRGGLIQFADLKGAWQERRGWCFWGWGVDTPMHTMWGRRSWNIPKIGPSYPILWYLFIAFCSQDAFLSWTLFFIIYFGSNSRFNCFLYSSVAAFNLLDVD